MPEDDKKVDAGDVKYGLAFIIVIAFVVAIFMPKDIVPIDRLNVLDRVVIMVVAFYFGRATLGKGGKSEKLPTG